MHINPSREESIPKAVVDSRDTRANWLLRVQGCDERPHCPDRDGENGGRPISIFRISSSDSMYFLNYNRQKTKVQSELLPHSIAALEKNSSLRKLGHLRLAMLRKWGGRKL